MPLFGRDRFAAVGRLPLLFTGLGIDDPLALGPLLGVVVFDAEGFLSQLGLGLDVDAPAGQTVGEASVLPLLADGERQLEVGDDDLGGAGVFVNPDLFDLGRRQRLGHEVVGVFAERDDVDLFPVELVHDHAHTGATCSDAGADGIDVLVV